MTTGTPAGAFRRGFLFAWVVCTCQCSRVGDQGGVQSARRTTGHLRALIAALAGLISLGLPACSTADVNKSFYYAPDAEGLEQATAHIASLEEGTTGQIRIHLFASAQWSEAQFHDVRVNPRDGGQSARTGLSISMCLAAERVHVCDPEPYIDAVILLTWGDNPSLTHFESSLNGLDAAITAKMSGKDGTIFVLQDGEARGARANRPWAIWSPVRRFEATAGYACIEGYRYHCETRDNVIRLAVFARTHTQTEQGVADRDDLFIDLGAPGPNLEQSLLNAQAVANREGGMVFLQAPGPRPTYSGVYAEPLHSVEIGDTQACGVFDFPADPRGQRETCIAYSEVHRIIVASHREGRDSELADQLDALGRALVVGGN